MLVCVGFVALWLPVISLVKLFVAFDLRLWVLFVGLGCVLELFVLGLCFEVALWLYVVWH